MTRGPRGRCTGGVPGTWRVLPGLGPESSRRHLHAETGWRPQVEKPREGLLVLLLGAGKTSRNTAGREQSAVTWGEGTWLSRLATGRGFDGSLTVLGGRTDRGSSPPGQRGGGVEKGVQDSGGGSGQEGGEWVDQEGSRVAGGQSWAPQASCPEVRGDPGLQDCHQLRHRSRLSREVHPQIMWLSRGAGGSGIPWT